LIARDGLNRFRIDELIVNSDLSRDSRVIFDIFLGDFSESDELITSRITIKVLEGGASLSMTSESVFLLSISQVASIVEAFARVALALLEEELSGCNFRDRGATDRLDRGTQIPILERHSTNFSAKSK